MRRVENNWSTVLLGASDQPGEKGPSIRPSIGEQRPQGIPSDGPCQALDAYRDLIQPRPQRVALRCQIRDFPMGVDIDKSLEPLPFSTV
jgi:hypothetical protein